MFSEIKMFNLHSSEYIYNAKLFNAYNAKSLEIVGMSLNG
jgi:hypothetical protein